MESNQKGKRKICIIKMTKRFLLITFLFYLCGIVSIAQNKNNEFENLVDYVNTYYVKSYIDKKINEKNSGFYALYIKDYKERIYPKWEQALISNNPISLNELLNNLGKHKNAIQLCNTINNKKEGFNPEWTKEDIIRYLIALPTDSPSTKNEGFFGYLKDETKELKRILERQIPDDLFNVKKGKDDNTSQSGNQKAEQSGDPGTKSSNLPVDLNPKEGHQRNAGIHNIPFGKIIFITFLALLSYLLYKNRNQVKMILNRFKLKSSKSKKLDEINFYKKEWEELEKENRQLRKLKQENADLIARIKKLELYVRELERKMQQYTEPNNEQPQKIVNLPIEDEEKPFTTSSSHLYADAIIDGVFHRISDKPNLDTVFELNCTSSSRTAVFGVYPEAFKRVIKNPDFVDGCDKQKINVQPQTLEIETGEATQDDFGKWKVIKKAKIKFV